MSTIYERIGGAPAIEAAVDIFYNKVINDKRINYWFSHMDMQAQRKKQDTFLTMAFGGPSDYTGRDMANAHLKLVERGLNDSHFDAVAENLISTLIELSVPQSLIDEIAEVLESQRDIVLCRQNSLEVTHAKEPSESDLVKEGYKQYTLEELSPEPGCEEKYIRLKFKPPGDVVPMQAGQHFQIITKVNDKWVQRSYTPVSDPHAPLVELLIKVYHEGPMSTYLSNLPVHSKVWMKGPLGHFIYNQGMAQTINMFACGSGITPMWQVINTIYKNTDDTTQVLLVHGCRHDNELALFDQLSQISTKRPQIRVTHTLTLPSNKWNGSKGRISTQNYESFKPFPPTPHTINLLCGTDDFVANLKKMLKDAGHSESSIVIF